MERCEMSVSELGTPHLTNFRTEIFWIEQLSNLFFRLYTNTLSEWSITHISMYSLFATILDLTFLASFVNPDMIIHTFD